MPRKTYNRIGKHELLNRVVDGLDLQDLIPIWDTYLLAECKRKELVRRISERLLGEIKAHLTGGDDRDRKVVIQGFGSFKFDETPEKIVRIQKDRTYKVGGGHRLKFKPSPEWVNEFKGKVVHLDDESTSIEEI